MSLKKIAAAAVHRGRTEQKQGKQLEGILSSPGRDNNDVLRREWQEMAGFEIQVKDKTATDELEVRGKTQKLRTATVWPNWAGEWLMPDTESPKKSEFE